MNNNLELDQMSINAKQTTFTIPWVITSPKNLMKVEVSDLVRHEVLFLVIGS